MIKYVEGDAIKATLEQKTNVLVQGCNCFTTMGAGIAKGIRFTWPGAYAADCQTKKGDRNKMGNFTFYDDDTNNITIVNAYTQYTYWDRKDMLSYDAIRMCMRKIKEKYSGRKIGMPQIGCGLAHGKWSKVEKIIEEELAGEDVTVYIFKG